MIQNYQDAMAICKWVGYPELFITLTCNPKWLEVVRFVESRGLKLEDRPDILCRIFKVKLDKLINDLRQNKIFGKVKVGEDIGNIISTEISNEVNDLEYYDAYGAHINVEWCNKSRSIKHLFKYVNKGHDRVTATFYGNANDGNVHGHMDEINMYYDCKYISPCEVAWRIFGFDIHYRDPPVERLNFHFPNKQNTVFSNTDLIDAIMNRNTMSNSMFSAWMDANKKYVEVRELTYAEFPTRFKTLSAGRQDIVLTTLNSSYLWKYCKVLKMTKNMELQSIDSDIDKDELKAFLEWISSIGDGTIGGPNDGHAMSDIPDDLLIMDTKESNLNIDLIRDLHTLEFFSAIKYYGVPNHQLKLKVDVPVMLLRNVDHSLGLCNGSRLVITGLGNHAPEGKVISGSNVGFKVLIPRMILTPTRLPFKFQRRQYPLVVSYAMTINKNQGQSLSHVELYLKKISF
ncbi:hypothetical protein FEM48_Zijuj08G0190600 [Ziziphus jujuba var. spinosa]|uniref:ATP-dependent DNA helicase n=1 Tax=Ziziphus jujuba var. spinosa TaxID=714518 RepID=A0A978V0U4_ZIZJJ|nr:hypothetical protein FEM48_Zijuj08G0190600 [Ziziphus jujuba var. spinosa]